MSQEKQTEQYLQTLGNTPRKSKFDPDLARQMNEEVKREERLKELRRKREAKKGKLEQETKIPEAQPIIIPSNFAPEDFILLQGRTHGTYSYPDLLVSMYKLGMTPEAEKAAQQLGYQIRNTAKESNGRDYIGNIDWRQGLSLNLALDGRTLSPRQFADFLLLLKSGDAFDGNGRKIPEKKLTEILNEITEVREPWRSELLDADFKYLDRQGNPTSSNDGDGKLWLYSSHILDASRDLIPNYKERLEQCLMVKGSRINLRTMNHQGMPIEEGNDFNYWCPDKDNNSVARFYADSGRVYLYCNRDPQHTGASLGVRLCVPKAHAQNFRRIK